MTEVNWIERGPNTIGGRTRALLLDPNDSSNKKLWAAGVSGGLWYTNDITSSNPDWNSVDGTWGNLAVCSINYDPNDTNTMYVGTGERMGIFSTASRGLGLWKTTDGGATWSHLSSTENFNYVTDILVRNEGGSSVVYIGVLLNCIIKRLWLYYYSRHTFNVILRIVFICLQRVFKEKKCFKLYTTYCFNSRNDV